MKYLKKYFQCPDCKGNGRFLGKINDPLYCPNCGGDGKRITAFKLDLMYKLQKLIYDILK